MEYLLAILQSAGGPDDSAPVLLILLTGISAFIFIFSLALFFISPGRREKIRVKDLSDQQIADTLRSRQSTSIPDSDENGDPLGRFLTPKKKSERVAQKEKLLQAGFYSQTSVVKFYSIKALLAIGLPILALIYVRLNPTTTTQDAFLYVLWCMGVGAFLPNIVLSKLIKNRQTRIRKSFADALDLLVVCVEAGMGLDAAFLKVSKSLSISAPELADEFQIVNASFRVGMPRVQALNEMLKRTGLKELKGLIAILDQSARYGTSVADSLRIFSEDFRDKRTQAAEEEAMKVGTKLILPMIVCIWPSFFIVAIGPAIITLGDVFEKMGGQ